MNKLFFVLIILLAPFLLKGQSSKVFDHLTMKSSILQSERKYAIYLPPGYETSQRSYPVLYLLHGSGDNEGSWIQFGEVQHITDNAINDGSCTPMVIVMPDADTGVRGYVNSAKGDWRYEDFFFQEFIPYIEKTYHIRAEKRYRAISGVSMGGEGTFFYALHHPEMFSSACPLSPAVGPLSSEDTKQYLAKRRNITDVTDEDADKFYHAYSVLYLLNHMPEADKNKVHWYIDCGDDDFLYEGNSLAHITLRDNKIPHEYRVRDGKHGWVYWRESLPEVLKFVSKPFHK